MLGAEAAAVPSGVTELLTVGFAAGPGFLVKGLFKEGFSGRFERTDNELLGIETMGEGEVEKFLKGFL